MMKTPNRYLTIRDDTRHRSTSNGLRKNTCEHSCFGKPALYFKFCSMVSGLRQQRLLQNRIGLYPVRKAFGGVHKYCSLRALDWTKSLESSSWQYLSGAQSDVNTDIWHQGRPFFVHSLWISSILGKVLRGGYMKCLAEAKNYAMAGKALN